MSYERQGLLLEKPTQPAEDAPVLASMRIARENVGPTYKQLTLDPERKAHALEQLHNHQSPNMCAEQLDDVALSERLSAMRAWKRELLALEDIGADIKQAYRWMINEDMANIHMLRASAAGDMRSFQRWNEFIYGKPNEQIYTAALDWIAVDAEGLIETFGADSAPGEAAQVVLDAIGGKRGDKTLLMPDEEVFEVVRQDHMREGGYYALLLDGVQVPEEGKVDQEMGEPILTHIVRNNLHSDYEIAYVDGSTWGVDHSRGVVEVPRKYNMVIPRFKGLGPGHEIGTHLLERVNGERGPVAAAGRGLDRNERGEGRAVLREQVVYENFDQFGRLVRWRDIMRRHIAISFACGTADDRPATAAGTYDFMYAIDLMYQTKLKPDDPEAASAGAQKKTDALIPRVLKGTDGTGGAYLKDIVYLEGNVAVWHFAKEHGPGAISDGDLGKFDITNPRHVAILQKAGLLPEYGD